MRSLATKKNKQKSPHKKHKESSKKLLCLLVALQNLRKNKLSDELIDGNNRQLADRY